MEQIFINFRTGDQDIAAPFLRDYLESRFGKGTVFYSSESIPAGDAFPEALLEHARECAVMLALIGPGWLTIAGPDGRPLLARPDDWVRREIATALAAGRRVVPVLVGEAARLSPTADLPGDIALLAERQSCRLRRASLAADLETLEAELAEVSQARWLPRPNPGAGGPSVTVGRNCGEVTGVQIGTARASGPSMRGLLKNISVNIGSQGPGGVTRAALIKEWTDTREWGNAADSATPE